MTIGLYIAVGFNSALICGLAILQTIQSKLFAQQTIKKINEHIEKTVNEQIKEHMRMEFVEINPVKAKEFELQISKDAIKKLDTKIVKYFNTLSQEEHEGAGIDWVLGRVRNIIFNEFNEILKDEKTTSELQ